MRAVLVHLNIQNLLCVDIAGNMRPPVDHKHLPALPLHLVGKDRAIQPCPHDQIIIPAPHAFFLTKASTLFTLHQFSSTALYLSSCA